MRCQRPGVWVVVRSRCPPPGVILTHRRFTTAAQEALVGQLHKDGALAYARVAYDAELCGWQEGIARA